MSDGGRIREQPCWSDSRGQVWRDANSPAAVAQTGPGTEQAQGHTEPYCPYTVASVTP